MRIFFDGGFLSVVRKPKETRLCLRARAARDLDVFRELHCPGLSPTTAARCTDYPFRAWATAEAVADALASTARAIRSANFKCRVAETAGEGRART